MSGAYRSHDAVNQTAPLLGVNLFTSDPALVALVDAAPQSIADDLIALGAFCGSQEAAELGRLANEHPPRLRTHDAHGARIDMVEYHPAYHALMRRFVGLGLHCSVWDAAGAEGNIRTVARAARLFLAAQVDAGVMFPLSMTNAGIGALAHGSQVAETWLPLIRSRHYDQASRPAREKAGAMLSSAIAEKQAGSDLHALTTMATRGEDRVYRLTGHKWFVSAPTSDALVTLAQTVEGLSAFLVPRYLQDGSRNAVRLIRLKDKLGDRSVATAEMEFEGAGAFMLGPPGEGESVIAEVSTLARLDAALTAAAVMRLAVIEAIHFARQRRAFGATLIQQPLMARVLADIALDAVAGQALAFRLAEFFDRAGEDPHEAAFARLMTPVTKYWVSKMAPGLVAEALECFGGVGAVEDIRLSRLYRQAPALAIADGPGNVMCLEVMRVLRKSSDPLEAVLAVAETALGDAIRPQVNVLRATTAVALADEGSARILTEQLALTMAAAALRRSFPGMIADAFIETRLGKEWRTTYGMLSSRFDADAFIEYVFPQG